MASIPRRLPPLHSKLALAVERSRLELLALEQHIELELVEEQRIELVELGKLEQVVHTLRQLGPRSPRRIALALRKLLSHILVVEPNRLELSKLEQVAGQREPGKLAVVEQQEELV